MVPAVGVPVTRPARKARRQELFQFLKEEAEQGRWPTNAKIAARMGWRNASSAPDALWALVRCGYLVPDKWRGRDVKFRIAGVDLPRADLDGANKGKKR